MTPLQNVLGRLTELGRDPHKNGVGWKACCPAHDDDDPSLTISEGNGGNVLLTCHAHCDFSSIVKSLGMKEADMFPPKDKPAAIKGAKRDGWPTVSDVADYLIWRLTKDDKERGGKNGEVTIGQRWKYTADFVVQRMNYASGKKSFRPIVRIDGRWQLRVPDNRPLYNRDELAAASVVVVTEGEKCCDLVRRLGLVATTSSSGSSSAHKTDWSDLAGKTVWILPDNDEAGEGYTNDVGAILAGLDPKPVVKVVKLPVANEGDDIEQWLAAGGTVDQLNAIAAAAPEWVPKPVTPKASAAARPSSGLPEIEIAFDREKAALESIKAIAADPEIYCRGSSLGIVVEEEGAIAKLSGGVELDNARGSARFLPLSRARVGCYLTKNALFYQWKKDRQGEDISVQVQPPSWLIESVETWGVWPGIRSILTITQCPYVRADGSIADPGYDPAVGALYRPTGAVPIVPERPGQREASDAADRLFRLVPQFPFKDGFDFSVWLAALLTAIQRPVIAGPVPGFAFTANKAGSGKGLLIDLVGILAWGNNIPTRSYPIDPAECGKVKLSLALAGIGSVHFDNLPEGGFYGSGELDSALTSTEVSGRILGASKESGSVPLRPVWMLSGNNVSPYKDAYRRWVPCRLNTPLESPHERSDLAVMNLRQHAREHRSELLADALTILRAHSIAGRPVNWSAPLGSFEQWDQVVRGAVWFATGNDCLVTQRQARDEAPDRLEKVSLLMGWSELPDGQTKGHTVKEAVDYAKDQPIPYATLNAVLSSITTKDGKTIDARGIGIKFRGLKDQNHGGWVLELADTAMGGVCRWRVRKA